MKKCGFFLQPGMNRKINYCQKSRHPCSTFELVLQTDFLSAFQKCHVCQDKNIQWSLALINPLLGWVFVLSQPRSLLMNHQVLVFLSFIFWFSSLHQVLALFFFAFWNQVLVLLFLGFSVCHFNPNFWQVELERWWKQVKNVDNFGINNGFYVCGYWPVIPVCLVPIKT